MDISNMGDGASNQQKPGLSSHETLMNIDRVAKLSEEDKAIMLDLVDIALGEKDISETTVTANTSETNKKTIEDVINRFVNTHFKTHKVSSLQHKSNGNDEKDNSKCQNKMTNMATANPSENVQHNTTDENNINIFQEHAVTNPIPSTSEKVLTPDLEEEEEEEDKTGYPIGLSSAEEEEIKEIIKFAEIVYKGKVDTTMDICKVEDESKYNITYDTMDTAEIDKNSVESLIKEEAVNTPTERNMKNTTTVAEKEKSDVHINICAAKTETIRTGRRSANHFFISDSNNQESEIGVGRILSKTNVDSDDDTMNDEHEEGGFDISNRGMMNLPMNDKHGRFFIDRSLFPVSNYQEGLSQKRWNPTAVLNELCTKLDWLPPEFGRVEYRPDQGFKVPVTVRGQKFLSTQWGHTKKYAKHISSTHFLKYLGFRFNFYDTSKIDVLERFDKFGDGYEDLDKERYHSSRNTMAVLNARDSCSERYYGSIIRRSGKEYERARKPDSKKLRSDDFSFNVTSRSSIVNRGSKSSDRSKQSYQKYSPDRKGSLNLKNTLESLNLKDILKLQDSAVIVINNFERTQGPSRRRRHSTSSSSPSPRKRSTSEKKQVDDTPGPPPNVSRGPARWRSQLYQDNVEVPPRHPQTADRSPHHRPVASRSQRCRCKLSFPHPSIHPWRTELGSSKYTSSESS